MARLPEGEEAGPVLQQQLRQMNWAGELEGWLTTPPRYHLVAEPETASAWKAYFNPDQPLTEDLPLPQEKLAALTARRGTGEDLRTNLLPPGYTARYKQQFIDRLWMRGLGAVLMVYVALAAVYLGWVEFAKWRYNRVQNQIISLGPTYTNTLQLEARVTVLQEQMDLQFAALDCWKAVADYLPPELMLNSLSLDRGRKLTIFGAAASGDVNMVHDFNNAMLKAMGRNQPLFKTVGPPGIVPMAGGQQVNWNFACELNRKATINDEILVYSVF